MEQQINNTCDRSYVSMGNNRPSYIRTDNNKIINDKQSGSGVVPYLSLTKLKKNTDTQSKKNEVKN